MFVVTGATGNTGKATAEALLRAGKKVRVIGRSAERLQPLADQGAEVFVGDQMDKEAMTKAFTGADAVYMLIPPNLMSNDMRGYYNEMGNVLADAVVAAGVGRVVFLSSVGAHRGDKVGPVKGLYDVEQILNRLEGVHVLHLRPSYFMENTLMSIQTVKNMGIVGTPVAPDVKFPIVASHDIGEYAAKRMIAGDYTGKSVQYLLGARDVTYSEITSIIAGAVGKPDLKYVQFPYADAIEGIVQMGLSRDIAENFTELGQAINEGILKPTQPRDAESTTPTSYEDFIKVYAMIYNS